MSVLTGMFGPGECSDTGANGIMQILSASSVDFNYNKFLNPQEINILNTKQGGIDAMSRFMVYYNAVRATPPPPPPIVIGHPDDLLPYPDSDPEIDYLEKAMQTYAKWPDIMDALHIWTDFLAGKSGVFPLPALEGKGITNEGGYFRFKGDPFCASNYTWQLLGTISFAGMLGLVHSAHRTDYVTCKIDPNDPCAKHGGVFGTIMGTLNQAMALILDGFNRMEVFAGKCRELIDKVEGYIATIVNAIANEINKLIAAALDGLRYGMAKLLQALGIDPCFKQVLGQICGPELKTALNLP